MLQRLADTLGHLRPRALARTRKTVDDLVENARELKQAVRTLAEQQRAPEPPSQVFRDDMRAQLGTIGQELAEIRQMLATLTKQESQLRAIAHMDATLERYYDDLGAILNATAVAAHVRNSIANATLHEEPFPYIVVNNLFPGKFADALVRGIPPVELFDGRVNKRQLPVPFTMAPAYSRRVWRFMAGTVADNIMAPIVAEKFRRPLGEWMAADWPALAGDPLAAPMNMHASEGRIMLRSRGYNIPPHRDPKWGFITCLIYLARPGDLETWGTALYAVDGDEEARGALPHWIKPERCRLAAEVPFRQNSALIFLNSKGAHGASIPEDAEPTDLQRYAYQFRIGPNRASITALTGLLSSERRVAWAGKIGDY